MEKKVLESLQRRCARAEYCSSDIYRKALKAMDGDAEAAARITASLVKDRFVDDLRYASAFAREKASLQGWGAVKIRFMLRGKGIDEATVSQALGEIDPAKASAKLEKVVREKNRTLEGDPQRKLKLIKFALGRGYSYDEVEKALRTLEESS